MRTFADEFADFVAEFKAHQKAKAAIRLAQEAAKAQAAPPPPPATGAQWVPTMKEYRALLASHDWYYEYTDDFSVWLAGLSRFERLRGMQRVLDPDMTIWRQYEPKLMHSDTETC